MNLFLSMMAANGWESVFGHVAALAGDPGDGEGYVSGLQVLETAGIKLPKEYREPEPVERSFLPVERERRWRTNLTRLTSAVVPSEQLGPWELWSVGVPIQDGLVVHVPTDKFYPESLLLFTTFGETEGRLRLVMEDQRVVASRFESSLHCQHRQCETEQHCSDPCGGCHCVPVSTLVGDSLLRGTACRCPGH